MCKTYMTVSMMMYSSIIKEKEREEGEISEVSIKTPITTTKTTTATTTIATTTKKYAIKI